MKIDTEFCGGNVRVLSISDDEATVKVDSDLRDTSEDWFYWAFRVRGAAGRTVTFDFGGKPRVGYFGAAVSRDLLSWHWSRGETSGGISSFSYTFAEDEDEVFFAHDMLYHPSRFCRFAERNGISVRTLCDDRRGTPVPYAIIGSSADDAKTVLLTARHHACEATGDYIMEGFLTEYLRSPLDGVRVICVPFVDADGVVYGDQGKARIPHDHNRDYGGESIYPTVRRIKELMAQSDMLAVFDLHSPWHCSGRNDKVFIVQNERNAAAQTEFSRYFAREITPDALAYDPSDDIAPGVDWNTHAVGTPRSCSTYASQIPDIALALSLETTYFGEVGNIFTQAKALKTGEAFCRGACRYLLDRQVQRELV